jgi:hypothetical protein
MMLVVALAAVAAEAQEARTVAEFCGVFQGACNRTCPSGPAPCPDECRSRAAACRSSGCFFFRSPGSRCFNNPADRRLTDARLAPDPDAERARRARQR